MGWEYALENGWSMSLPTANFWRLLEESRLQTSEQCQQLRADFAHVKGAGDGGNSKTLVEWLVARNILSRYQTTILLGGRSGPFMYGDYSCLLYTSPSPRDS